LSIDEEDLPIIIDDVDPDDEEDEQIEKMLKRVQNYIKQHRVTPKTYTKRKQKALKELKEHLDAVDLLLLSEAYLKRETFSGFVRKHEALRKGFLKALLSNLNIDAQIYVLQELLNDICGDEEPVDYYIGKGCQKYIYPLFSHMDVTKVFCFSF